MNFHEKIPLHRKGLVYIAITAFLWSSSGLFIKILTLNAYQISFYRSLIAAVTLLIISYGKHRTIKFEFDKLTVLASLFYAGILIFFVVANKLTTSANAIFLQFTAPIYLLFLEPFFLKTKFRRKDLITIVICISGMALFFMGKLEIGNIYGNLIAIAAGICFAMFSLFIKWKKTLGNENTIISIIYGNLLVGIICFPFIFNEIAVSSTQFYVLLYMGVVQIGVSYFIFNIGIKYVSATESMIIGMLEAIFNPIWVFFGVGEVPATTAVIGGVIIFAAILIHNFLPLKKNTGQIS
ncbi:MAG: DMT family transporter [Ignavibacteriae bacterium]|nr:DMT family transporter [Ignavibacteriota bacterium]